MFLMLFGLDICIQSGDGVLIQLNVIVQGSNIPRACHVSQEVAPCGVLLQLCPNLISTLLSLF